MSRTFGLAAPSRSETDQEVDAAIRGNALRLGITPGVEVWMPILDFPDYEVSSEGRVLSLARVIVCKNGMKKTIHERIMKTFVNRNGYLIVVLSRTGFPPSTKLVHSLVVEAFDRRRNQGEDTRHLNGNSLDNRAVNLCIGTTKDNANDAVFHRTSPGFKNTGERSYHAKLTEMDVWNILAARQRGESLKKIAKLFGVTYQNIGNICLGKTWKHLHDPTHPIHEMRANGSVSP